MKYLFLIFAAVVCICTSCKKTNLLNVFNLNAKVVSELTNQPVSNARLYIRIVSTRGVGLFRTTEYLNDSTSVVSDNNGNINCNLNYSNDPTIVVEFYKSDDNSSTGLLPQKTAYAIADLKTTSPLIFYVHKYAKLQINLKSINPFDENDAAGLSIIEYNTNYQNNGIDSIKNYGVINQPLGYPAANVGTNPYWVGKTVNSIIYGKIQEGALYQITWDIRKNGIHTIYNSPQIQTLMTSPNVYDINY